MSGLWIGVLAAFMWWVIGYGVLLWLRWRRFSRLGGRYRVTKKTAPDNAVAWEVFLRRRRRPWQATNTFEVTYKYADPSHGTVNGEIAMSDVLPMSGEGAYTQVKPKPGEAKPDVLWGTWTVTTPPCTEGEPIRLLVDLRYTKNYGDRSERGEKLEAYVWTQIE